MPDCMHRSSDVQRYLEKTLHWRWANDEIHKFKHKTATTKKKTIYSTNISGTKTILGVGLPLHKPYAQLPEGSTSFLGTWIVWVHIFWHNFTYFQLWPRWPLSLQTWWEDRIAEKSRHLKASRYAPCRALRVTCSHNGRQWSQAGSRR